MYIKKQFLIIFILSILVLTVTGCTIEKGVQNENQAQNQQKEDNITHPARNQNLEEANLEDLKIGIYVSVAGTENSDGSVSAGRIIIGNSGTDFKRIAGLRQPLNDNNNQAESGGGQLVDRNKPNFEQMQNMSEKERMKFREEMKVQREAGGGRSGRANMGGGIARLSGEIIDKNDTTITLKIKEGGSKLIFYSSETKIFKFKDDNKEKDLE